MALADALGDELALAAGTILAEVFAVLVELADGVAFAEEVPEADGDALADGTRWPRGSPRVSSCWSRCRARTAAPGGT